MSGREMRTMPGEFQGKVVVITGGSRGIGREIAVDFARAGAQTVIVSSSRDEPRRGEQDRGGGRRAGAARDRRRICADARRLPAGVQAGAGQVQPLRHPGELRGRDARRQFRRPAGRGLDGRLRAEVLRLRADVPAVLADAEGRAGPCRQHHRRRGAHAGRRLHHRRLGQRRDGQFLQERCRSSASATASTSTPSIPARPTPSASANCSSSARRRPASRSRSCARRRPPRTASAGIGKAEDISALTLFLCSEQARHIQGTAIAVDGGATVGDTHLSRSHEVSRWVRRARAACVVGLAGQAFALAADPRPLDQAPRLDAEYRREEVAPEAFADFFARLARARLRRRQHHAAAQGGGAGGLRARRPRARGRRRPTRSGSTAAICIRPTPTSKASPPISTPRCPAGTKAADEAVVLGAGGSARAVVYGLIERGFARVHVVNRTPERARGACASASARRCSPRSWSALPHLLARAGLLVNTTSLGMTGQPPLDIDLAPLPPRSRGRRPGLRAARDAAARRRPRARARHRRRARHAAAPGGAGVSALVRGAAGGNAGTAGPGRG